MGQQRKGYFQLSLDVVVVECSFYDFAPRVCSLQTGYLRIWQIWIYNLYGLGLWVVRIDEGFHYFKGSNSGTLFSFSSSEPWPSFGHMLTSGNGMTTRDSWDRIPRRWRRNGFRSMMWQSSQPTYVEVLPSLLWVMKRVSRQGFQTSIHLMVWFHFHHSLAFGGVACCFVWVANPLENWHKG